MLKHFAAAALALLTASASWATATYSITSGTYNGYATGTYTGSQFVTGSFTLLDPLEANLSSADITSRVLSFSFNDGSVPLMQITKDSAASYIFERVDTDGAGNITGFDITVRANAAPTPDKIRLYDGGDAGSEVHHGTGNSAGGYNPGTFSVVVTANPSPATVPTLGEWGLLGLGGLMVAGGAWQLRRRRPDARA